MESSPFLHRAIRAGILACALTSATSVGHACTLDVDLDGVVGPATDAVYIQRHLAGLAPVPAAFRTLDPSIPPDGDIAERIDEIGTALDLDGNGSMAAGTDALYLVRRLAGLAPVQPSFRGQDSTIPSDATIDAAVGAQTDPRDLGLWPFDSRSPWNHPLGTGAQFAGESNPMTVDFQSGNGVLNHHFYSHRIWLAELSDPLTTVTQVDGSPESFEYRIPAAATPDPGSDGSFHVITPDRRYNHETREAIKLPDGNYEVGYHVLVDIRGPGIGTFVGDYIGISAYGGSALGGVIRKWEVEAGEIRHALSMGLKSSQLKAGPWPSAVWPATGSDPTEQYSGSIPMGQLFAIKPNTNLDALGLSAAGLAVARALQRYGAYPIDSGANGPVFVAEPALSDALAEDVRDDLDTLVPLIFPVLNNAETNVGGGGDPLAPCAPPAAPSL